MLVLDLKRSKLSPNFSLSASGCYEIRHFEYRLIGNWGVPLIKIGAIFLISQDREQNI